MLRVIFLLSLSYALLFLIKVEFSRSFHFDNMQSHLLYWLWLLPHTSDHIILVPLRTGTRLRRLAQVLLRKVKSLLLLKSQWRWLSWGVRDSLIKPPLLLWLPLTVLWLSNRPRTEWVLHYSIGCKSRSLIARKSSDRQRGLLQLFIFIAQVLKRATISLKIRRMLVLLGYPISRERTT